MPCAAMQCHACHASPCYHSIPRHAMPYYPPSCHAKCWGVSRGANFDDSYVSVAIFSRAVLPRIQACRTATLPSSLRLSRMRRWLCCNRSMRLARQDALRMTTARSLLLRRSGTAVRCAGHADTLRMTTAPAAVRLCPVRRNAFRRGSSRLWNSPPLCPLLRRGVGRRWISPPLCPCRRRSSRRGSCLQAPAAGCLHHRPFRQGSCLDWMCKRAPAALAASATTTIHCQTCAQSHRRRL